jgi:hypothetical protein
VEINLETNFGPVQKRISFRSTNIDFKFRISNRNYIITSCLFLIAHYSDIRLLQSAIFGLISLFFKSRRTTASYSYCVVSISGVVSSLNFEFRLMSEYCNNCYIIISWPSFAAINNGVQSFLLK